MKVILFEYFFSSFTGILPTDLIEPKEFLKKSLAGVVIT
jgi:hypothetical protein